MTMQEEGLRPEEFAEAAAAAIEDAQGRAPLEVAQVLAQAGLTGVCAQEDDGGLGLSVAYAVPIAHAAGKLRLQFPLAEQLLLAKAFAGTPWGAELAVGDKLATVALQGNLAQGFAGAARHADVCDWVLVAEAAGEGSGAVLLDVASVVLEADKALDPEYPQQWLRLEGAKEVARLDAVQYAALQHEVQLLLAAWVNGAADGALETAATYMSARVQFGRPLSAKQAVRHWLARMKLVQEVSAAAIQRVLESNEYGQARSARPALAGALTNAAFVIEKAIHLHGGMGFTWEVPLHYALREVRKLDAALGSGSLSRATGRAFMEAA